MANPHAETDLVAKIENEIKGFTRARERIINDFTEAEAKQMIINLLEPTNERGRAYYIELVVLTRLIQTLNGLSLPF